MRIEAVIEIGDLLTQHAIRADHLGAPPAVSVIRLAAVEDEKMVEDRIECVLVAPRQHGECAGRGRHLLVEHFVAEPLRAPELALLAGQPNFERADAAVDLWWLEAAERTDGESSAPHEG